MFRQRRRHGAIWGLGFGTQGFENFTFQNPRHFAIFSIPQFTISPLSVSTPEARVRGLHISAFLHISTCPSP